MKKTRRKNATGLPSCSILLVSFVWTLSAVELSSVVAVMAQDAEPFGVSVFPQPDPEPSATRGEPVLPSSTVDVIKGEEQRLGFAAADALGRTAAVVGEGGVPLSAIPLRPLLAEKRFSAIRRTVFFLRLRSDELGTAVLALAANERAAIVAVRF
jgi:hypothetical protein